LTPILADLEDAELSTRVLAGSDVAFGEIMRRHEDSLYRLVRGLVGDADEALDIVQECFIAAYRAFATYDRARPLRAWLARIAINKARDWGRRKVVRRYISMAMPGVAGLWEQDAAPSAEAVASDRQALDRTFAAIAKLPPQLKEVLLLRTVEGLAQVEVAAILSISDKAVETRLRRARRRLSEHLA
jgi:RNA polymerase sigma-70 factor (ECF subfamily)